MEKEEILEMSRKLKIDEGKLEIEKSANANAYVAIIAVNTLMIIAIFIQKLITGKAFADSSIFFLAILVSAFACNLTKYRYEKKKEYLFVIVIGFIGTIACIINIVMAGNGYWK